MNSKDKKFIDLENNIALEIVVNLVENYSATKTLNILAIAYMRAIICSSLNDQEICECLKKMNDVIFDEKRNNPILKNLSTTSQNT